MINKSAPRAFFCLLLSLSLGGCTLLPDSHPSVSSDQEAIVSPPPPTPYPGRWSAERANAWYADQDWSVGANFVPSTASNEFEMWQADTFDPETLDRELAWASDIGMNAMRVFLHDMLWAQDRDGFFERIDQYLEIADARGVKTIFVLFDAVWDPFPKLGPQEEPRPGIHNSRWAQAPHIEILKDPARHAEVKPYVQDVLTHYKNDDRVLMWDLYNEPGNRAPAYWQQEPKNKVELSTVFLKSVIQWAREVDPSQPMTTGVWLNVGQRTDPVHPIDQLMIANSDVISFHHYGSAEQVEEAIAWLESFDRPLVCTEYMSRTTGNTFDTILPIFKNRNVGAINWGLVSGRSQTIYSWQTWMRPDESAVEGEPDLWFHDVFRADGTPYDASETDIISRLTDRPAASENSASKK